MISYPISILTCHLKLLLYRMWKFQSIFRCLCSFPGMANTCNDWKVLDPAILSSSRSYQLPQMPSAAVRDPYASIPPLGNQQITQNGPVRPFDYPPSNSSPFSAFTQQLQQQQQPNYNSFTHLNTPQNVSNLNWFTANDINSQISSPPGFRNSQTSKQQEC